MAFTQDLLGFVARCTSDDLPFRQDHEPPCFASMAIAALSARLSRNALIGACRTISDVKISAYGHRSKSQRRSTSAFSIPADTAAASALKVFVPSSKLIQLG